MKRALYLQSSGLVKTIMMLVIVAFHCIANWGISDWFLSRSNLIPVIKVIAEWLSSFHTSTFVFTAGFIFCSVSNSGNHYHSFLDFEITKAKRLLVPYAFVSLFWCIPGGVFIFGNTLQDIIKKYFFGLSPAQLWFLLMLFGVYSVFYILDDLFQDNPQMIIIAVTILYAAGLILRRYIPNIYMIWRTTDMLPVFTAGYILNKFIDKTNEKILLTCSFLLHISLFVLHIRANLGAFVLPELITLGMHVSGACFFFAAIASIGIKFCTIKKNKIITFLGKRSMPIYLIHQQLIWLLLLFIEDKLPPYICMPLIFGAVLILSVAISSILLKYNCTRMMIGEKKLIKGDQA